MNAAELLSYQFDDLEYQLRACLESLSESDLDARLKDGAYSPRETIAHLCEAYEAFLARTNMTEWKWGSYKLPDDAKDAAFLTLWETRGRAKDAACNTDLEDVHRLAHAYAIAHDSYHVGQLSLLRIELDPDWDPYCIYKHD